MFLAFAPEAAWSNCTGTATTNVTCDTSVPNPYTSRIGNGPNAPNNVTVNIGAGAQINALNSAAISLRDNSVINLGANSSVTNNITVQPGQPNYDSVINGLYNTNPWNGAGPNTIEFHTGNTLNIDVGATISGNGDTNSRAEAINIIGFNNTIINRGTITSTNRPAIWFQDEQRSGVAGTTNTIDNYGTISTGLGNSSPVIGNNANGSVIFTNRTGARVVGSLQFAGGNDQLTLEAGSVITGSFEGGGGTNSLTLSGVAGSADTLAGDIRDFQTLTKTGDGRWTLTGAVGANGGNAALQVFVNQGVLALTGNNANFNGSVLVAPAGILEGRSQSLPPTITDNGLVRFQQDSAGTYSGTISGTGAVEKNLGGDLTLAGTNSYSGGTTVNSGTVFISTDANLGAASGGVTLNGGSLGSIANVTTARATTVGPLGGGLNTSAGTTLTHTGTISGPGVLSKNGTGTAILTGNNSYSGGTIVSEGVLQVSSNANLGAAGAVIAFNGGTLRTTADMTTARTTLLGPGGGTLETNAGTTLTYGGTVSGTGGLAKTGGGTLLLTGSNSYTGGTRVSGGIIEIANDASLGAPSGLFTLDGGTLRITQNVSATRDTIVGPAGGTVQVVAGVDVDYSGSITGSGSYTKTGAGNIFLSGTSSFTGGMNVNEGSVFVNGNLSAATGTTTVASGARLSGEGTLGGPVVVSDGARLTAGAVSGAPGTLTMGSLTMSPGTDLFLNIVDTTVGGALNDLINVNGNLVLDGRVDVLEQQQTLGPGVYRIINYTGTLTNNILDIGSIATIDGMPSRTLSGFSVQTVIPGQVNLINTQGLSLSYWDGDVGPKNNNVINGGNGLWRHAGDASTSNWTDPAGAVNAPWADGQFAIFVGTPGTVSVTQDQGAVTASGMQFGATGYLVQGLTPTDTITLVGTPDTPGESTIRVGDGTGAGSSITATVSAPLTGSTLLRKTDAGTLILTGINSYAGGTQIEGGVLQVAADANLGAASGGLTFNSGTLRTTADISTSRTTVLNSGGGTFDTATGTTLTLSGAMSGVGSLRHNGAGNLTLLTDSSHSGGTINFAGTLQLGNGGTTGAITGPAINNGTLLVNRSNQLVLDGPILGSGSLVQAGGGTTVLTGANLYTGDTTISAGALQLGNGGTTGSVTGPIVDNATLVIDRSNDFTLASAISGIGQLIQAGAGRTILTGTNSYTGDTTVSGGRLYIDGNQSAATGAAVAMSGTRLGGSGIIGGNVAILDGATLSPGSDSLVPGTLTINGNLTLNPSSTMLYNITSTVVGGAGNDLTVVGGNLVLDGTINVVDQGQTLGPGVYRVFNYTGTLTNNGLTIGGYTSDGASITRPLTDFIVQTVIPKQVNLINTSGADLNYWDGEPVPNKNNNLIDGGNGFWRHAGMAATFNWTDPAGALNASWGDSQFAIFLGAPGEVRVTLDSGAVTTSGMQFGVNGYTLVADTATDVLTLVSSPSAPGEATIRVGDGTSAGAAMTATISAPLTGNVLLNKTDAGTLILSGVNTYTGGTRIEGGVIQIATDTALGSATSRLTLNGGTLRMTASLDKTRPITVGPNGGAFDTVSGTSSSILSAIDGTGSLAKIGDGTLTFLADNSYTGATTIGAGILQLGNGGTAGGVVGDIVDNAALIINRSNTLTLPGVISGTGSLTQAGTGTTILAANNEYTGGTTISAGTLQIGNGGTTGHVVGNILDNGTLIINRSDTKLTPGFISGTGRLIQAGTGTTVLQADNSYTGGTTISAGTLQLGDGGTAGSVVGDVVDNGALVINRSDEYTYSGVITGTGSFEQAGPGKTILTATSLFTGGTTVSAGILQLGDGTGLGGVTGDVLDNATLIADWAAPVFYAGSVSGTGNVILNNPSLTILTGDHTFTGGTELNGGRVEIGHIGTVTLPDGVHMFDGSTGSFLGDVVNNTTNGLAINRSDSFLITGVISGAGSFEQMGPGTTILEANNSYTGGTLISAGTLQIGNGGTTGLVLGDIVDNSRLVFNRSDTKIVDGVVSGTGELVQAGLGTLIIDKTNSYEGGTAIESGILQISADNQLGAALGDLRISGGTLRTTADIISARTVALVNRTGTIETLGGTTLTLDGLVSGGGGLIKAGGGTLILTNDNSYAGDTMVAAGTLRVDGDQTATAGLTTVQNGATLAGTGIIGGSVTVRDGGIFAPGDSPGTLTINGDLSFTPGSRLAYDFGAANVVGGALNDLAVVGGNLVLDGTIDVSISAGGSFDPGIYRVFNYAGSLTNNGLRVGTIPAAKYYVQTSIAGQVNLINTTGLTLNYWDGAAGPKNDGGINGGNGIWQSGVSLDANDNWTTDSGTPNAPFSDGAFAIFAGAPGTVTVDDGLGPVTVAGMQFATGGYGIEGDAVNLVGPVTSIVRVGDGTAAGAGMSATISAPLAGPSSLTKTDLGTLILSGANSYSGGTVIDSGVLQVSNDTNLGAASGGIEFNSGTLRTTDSFSTPRTITLTGIGGTVEPVVGTTLTASGPVGGEGALTKTGAGTLILTASNNYAGGTTVKSGVLQIVSDANLGAGAGGLTLDGGTLRTTADITTGRTITLATGGGTFEPNASTNMMIQSAIAGPGSLAKTGEGILILQAVNSYTGPTLVAAGALAVGDAAHATAAVHGPVAVGPGATFGGYGSVNGDVTNSGTVAVADAIDIFAASGSGQFRITGTLTNAGTAALDGAGVGNRLVVANYVGQNGLITMNTRIIGDDSPTDQLVINGGTTSGGSGLLVRDAGGGGALTPGNGIEVIVAANGATTTPTAFMLAERVVAGPYQYNLFRGGRDGGFAESWFLRTEYVGPTPPPPVPPIAPVPPPTVNPPPVNPPPVTPSPPPLYRPEVPTYTVTPSMALMFGRDLIGTLHDRVGDRAQLIGRARDGMQAPDRAWGRIVGQRNTWDAAPGGVYNQDPAFRASTYAMQIGVDLVRDASANSVTVAGVYGAYGWNEGIVKDFDLSFAGDVKFDAFTAGLYATHYGAGGWYVDGVLQVTRYRVRAGSHYFADMRTKGTGLAGSLEAGVPIKLSQRFSIEPQGQIIYQGINLNDSADPAAEVRFDDVKSLTGRLGLRLVHKGERAGSDGPRPITTWIRANAWREFIANPKTSFSSADGFVPFHSNIKSTWADFGAGASAELTRGAKLFASGSYQTAFGHQVKSWGVRGGIKFSW